MQVKRYQNSNDICLQIKPTGALDYPNLDEATVKLLTRGEPEELGVTITPVQEGNRLAIEAKYKDDDKRLVNTI